MTAFHSTQMVPPSAQQCFHPRLSLGLDHAYCPDCRSSFSPRTSEYKQCLRNSSSAQTSQKVCSGPGSNPCTESVFATEQFSGPEQIYPGPEHRHWTETYSPANRKSHTYYRYMWREGRRIKHIHIPGGSALKASRAQLNWLAVERAIASGQSPSEIIQLIKSWRSQ